MLRDPLCSTISSALAAPGWGGAGNSLHLLLNFDLQLCSFGGVSHKAASSRRPERRRALHTLRGAAPSGPCPALLIEGMLQFADKVFLFPEGGRGVKGAGCAGAEGALWIGWRLEGAGFAGVGGAVAAAA